VPPLKRVSKKPGKPGVPAPAGPKEDEGPKFFELATEEEGDSLRIKLEDISPNPFNDRDLGDVTQLAESIEQDDLLQEVTVMHTSAFAEFWPEEAAGITTRYTLAFGERRWRAHMHLGRETIAAVLKNSAAPKIRRVLFAENYHRKQLSPVEEARKFHFLHTVEGMSYREIVAELKLKGPNHVSRRMELLELPEALQEIVGTEDGPGVTLARNLKSQLAEPDDQVRAWELIRDEGLSAKQAVDRIRNAEPVPPGNTSETEQGKSEAVPQGNTAEPTGEVVPKPRVEKAERPAGGKRPAAADRNSAERNNASADRDAACLQLITAQSKLTAEQHDGLFGRTLLAPMQQGPARTRAHKWLRTAGAAVFDVNDTDSYFAAVLSSGQTELVNRVAIATALAACEVRAGDGRRQWDRTDAEHVRLLIDAIGYVPETAWERAQLDNFGVPYDGADDPDPETIH
jgi:ParB/RepB/Spo0J family partition protein